MNNKNITVNKIVEICNGKLLAGEKNIEIETYSKDTRTLKKGDMYLGIKGEKINGNNYIEQAFINGAIGCITDENVNEEIINKYKEKVIIKVENTIKAIQELAKYKRSLYDIPVIAVTGSVGKTSTKDIIANVLGQKYKVLKTEGNMNNHIGLPMTLLKLKDHTAVVVEMGMNHFGEISLLTNIAKPTGCVITNIGTSHIGNLGSRENILKAKLEILEGLDKNGFVLINNDNDLLHEWAKKEKRYKIYTYGLENNSTYMAKKITTLENSSEFEINGIKGTVPIGGIHFVYNSVCAFAVGDILNVEKEKIIKGISKFKLTAKRMDIEIIQDNIKIIYYENDYAEVIKDDLSIIVEKSEHIRYDGYIFEIVYQNKEEVNIKDLIDIKKITLNNTNQKEINYIIVLEETSNYEKYNLKKLPEECLRFSIYNNGKMNKNNLLSNNLKGKEGYEFNNNTYLLYEGKLNELSTTDIDIGMWIDYEQTNNENMNSAFIGTVRVYIE